MNKYREKEEAPTAETHKQEVATPTGNVPSRNNETGECKCTTTM